MMKILIYLLMSSGVLGSSVLVPYTSYDQRLKDHLLKNYNYQGMPYNGQLQVQISLSLTGILWVDQKKDQTHFSIILRLGYTDTRLTWNPNEWGGLTYIILNEIHNTKAFYPILSMYQMIGLTNFPETDVIQLMLQNTGEIYLSRAGKIVL